MKRHLHILLACALLLTGCASGATGATGATAAASSAPAPAQSTPAAASAPVEKTQAKSDETAGAEIAFEFTGKVLALTPTTVLVAVDKDCALYKSSDQVTFGTRGLAAIGVQEGDRVRVGCGEMIRETYPAQVDARTWEVLEAEPAAEPVVYDRSGDSMSVTLPADWEYEQYDELADPTPAAEDETDPAADVPADPEVIGHTIAFWPSADPGCRVELTVEKQALGICGTGVTFEERTFANAGPGTVAYEDHDEGRWLLVIFAAEDGRYTVRWSPDHAQLETYEETFWSIVDTITVGNEV